jgi:filamentous hemagglutinin
MHTAVGGLVGDVSGAAGAGTAGLAAPKLNEMQANLEDALIKAGMNATLAKGVAANVSGVTAAGIGGVVGGTTGAGAGLSVDANNRQLHPDEKALAKKLAEKSKGKYTPAEIEGQMRMMGNSRYGDRANKVEVFVDTSDPATAQRMQETFKRDPTLPIAAQGRSVVEVLGNPNLELQNYIVANSRDAFGWIPDQSPYVPSTTKGPLSTSNMAPTQATARCGNADADCKAGVPKPLTEHEMADRRMNVAEVANTVGTQAGRVGATAIAASAIPGPHEPAAAATAITANVVQIGATAVQHALQPNPGALGVDTVGTGIAEASKAIPRYGKLVAPVVNEVNESVKTRVSAKLYKTGLMKGLRSEDCQ